jgi:hypothetical protein
MPLPRNPQSLAAYSSEIGSAVGIYFEPLSAGVVRAFVIINEEHICLRAEPIRFTEGKPLYAVVDLFGTSKAVSVVPVKRSGLFYSTFSILNTLL